MDRLTPEQRSKNMRAVKSSGSLIESALAEHMFRLGIRYRKNVKDIYGKPDFAIKKYRLAIFCDSEFWHGYNWGEKKKDHKSNVDFWTNKIERNIKRDKEVNKVLKQNGWTIKRFWGMKIQQNPEKCAKIILRTLNEIKTKNIS